MTSVIVPVYNDEANIGCCISSLLKQSYGHFEILIVDDNSRDNTRRIIEKYRNIDSRIKYFRNEKRMGPAHARNRGVEYSKNEIIAFIDSDCVAEKEWLLKLIKPILENKASIIQGINYIDLTNRFWSRIEAMRVEASMSFKRCLDTKNLALKKSIFQKLNGFNDKMKILEDIDLGWRLEISGYDFILSEALVKHNFSNNILIYFKKAIFEGFNFSRLFKKHNRNIYSLAVGTKIIIKSRYKFFKFKKGISFYLKIIGYLYSIIYEIAIFFIIWINLKIKRFEICQMS